MLLLPNNYHTAPFDNLFILLGQMFATLTLDVPDKVSAKVCSPTGSSSWHFLRSPAKSSHICKHTVSFCFEWFRIRNQKRNIGSISDATVVKYLSGGAIPLSPLFWYHFHSHEREWGKKCCILYNVYCLWEESPLEMIKVSQCLSTPLPY